MRNIILCGAAVVWLAAETSALAWGTLGHQTIAIVAMENLNPDVKAKVQKILDNSDIAEVKTIADAAIWPDAIKKEQKWYSTPASGTFNAKYPNNPSWHFDNYPLAGAYDDNNTNFTLTNDVVQMINHCVLVLEHKTGPGDFTDIQALCYLVHLVGDEHQPLHIGCGYYTTNSHGVATLKRDPADIAGMGLANDSGGNDLTWTNVGHTNIYEFHAFWDDTLVEANGSTTNALCPKILTNWNSVTLAARPSDYHQWAEAWASDTLLVANKIYFDASGLKGKPSIIHKTDLVIKIPIGKKFDPTSYKTDHAADAKEQLTKAAHDLADLLNAMAWP